MKRNKLFLMAALLTATAGPATAQTALPLMKTNISPLQHLVDGKPILGGWHVVPNLGVDEFKTTGRKVTFISDVDTFSVELDEWQTVDFGIITAKGDTALTRVRRLAANPFESPDPELRKVAPSGLLSREQAAFDIDALLYTLTEVHPDIYSVCKQVDLLRAVNEAKASLPDSVSKLELFSRVAPIVSQIGDGHTKVFFPFNDVFTKDLKRIPLFFSVKAKDMLTCRLCVDSIIPSGARILDINGHTAGEMLDTSLRYVSGEREHFKLSTLDEMFLAYFQMLYGADAYTVRYTEPGAKKPKEVTFPAMLFQDFTSRMPHNNRQKDTQADLPYSFSIDRAKNVALLNFRRCDNVDGMKAFADSLFRTLRNEGIENLIIDVRQNGGGNSAVGDVLLRYVVPEPFVQMEKALVKITAYTAKLLGSTDIRPRIRFTEIQPESYLKPLSDGEGHFRDRVYLLTSNYTFSAAASFAWAFKTTGAGCVIGEETGGMNVSYGDYLNYRMPISRLACGISFKRFWQFRADEDEIHGTIPDVDVPAGDALATAFKLIKKNKKRKGR